MVAPVAARVEVVGGMIAVVEAEAVARDVEERDAGPEVGVRVGLVDEGVLAPVPDHEAGAHGEEGDQVDEEGGARVEGGEEGEISVGGEFGEEGFEREGGLVFAEEVEGEVGPDEEEEAQEVVEEVGQGVALVADGGGEVRGPVAFDVVVFYVVEVI